MKSFFISIFYFLYFFTSCNSLIKKDNQYAAVDYDYHLYLNAALNDSINLKLILDTGANGFYIDSTFCNKNKMKANISSIYVRGVGEKNSRYQY
ncbi:MAG: hypothetical protein M0D53_05940 [Flavobacterium sp. JAD_PAG50586_2]|nr:MAG: hypothetical protein M0D53_05940 [Flavobacterium sp. JAD_PAG50586_2]